MAKGDRSGVTERPVVDDDDAGLFGPDPMALTPPDASASDPQPAP